MKHLCLRSVSSVLAILMILQSSAGASPLVMESPSSVNQSTNGVSSTELKESQQSAASHVNHLNQTLYFTKTQQMISANSTSSQLLTELQTEEDRVNAFNSLFGTEIPLSGNATGVSKRALDDLVGDPNFDMTAFISTLLPTNDLYIEIKNSHDKRQAFNFLYNTSIDVNSQLTVSDREILFGITGGSQYSEEKFLNHLVEVKHLWDTIQVNDLIRYEFNTIYHSNIQLSNQPTEADLEVLFGVVGSEGYDDSFIINDIHEAYDLVSLLSDSPDFLRFFNLLFGSHIEVEPGVLHLPEIPRLSIDNSAFWVQDNQISYAVWSLGGSGSTTIVADVPTGRILVNGIESSSDQRDVYVEALQEAIERYSQENPEYNDEFMTASNAMQSFLVFPDLPLLQLTGRSIAVKNNSLYINVQNRVQYDFEIDLITGYATFNGQTLSGHAKLWAIQQGQLALETFIEFYPQHDVELQRSKDRIDSFIDGRLPVAIDDVGLQAIFDIINGDPSYNFTEFYYATQKAVELYYHIQTNDQLRGNVWYLHNQVFATSGAPSQSGLEWLYGVVGDPSYNFTEFYYATQKAVELYYHIQTNDQLRGNVWYLHNQVFATSGAPSQSGLEWLYGVVGDPSYNFTEFYYATQKAVELYYHIQTNDQLRGNVWYLHNQVFATSGAPSQSGLEWLYGVVGDPSYNFTEFYYATQKAVELYYHIQTNDQLRGNVWYLHNQVFATSGAPSQSGLEWLYGVVGDPSYNFTEFYYATQKAVELYYHIQTNDQLRGNVWYLHNQVFATSGAPSQSGLEWLYGVVGDPSYNFTEFYYATQKAVELYYHIQINAKLRRNIASLFGHHFTPSGSPSQSGLTWLYGIVGDPGFNTANFVWYYTY